MKKPAYFSIVTACILSAITITGCRSVSPVSHSIPIPSRRSNLHGKSISALNPVSPRCVYSGVAEPSIYVACSARGCGVGNALLGAIIDESESRGIWMLQAGVFPENTTSLALIKSCGFREVGHREHIGQMDGVWRNVILMERRSKVVGIGK